VSELRFDELRRENVDRCHRWHGDFPDGDWTGADWSNAMCGEAGEAANVVKKLRRHETGHPGAEDMGPLGLVQALANELADVVIYADLLAAKYGIDLGQAVVDKFNFVSRREGFPERICRRAPHELWRQAHDEHPGDASGATERYLDLMRLEGHIVRREDA
jgi:NTP pyrophosphatase (non-canonical NTP hydrolase)